MHLEPNVGGTDRILPAVLMGLVLLAAAAAATGRWGLAGIETVGGVGLLGNALTQFCGINALLGVNTCKMRRE